MVKKLIQPILFSQRFGVSAAALKAAGLFDPILNSDSKLFIDPLLLHKSTNPTISRSGLDGLKQGFGNVVALLEASKNVGDAAWRAAFKALDLSERSETSLGYGGSGIAGSSRPPRLRNKILATTKEIITLGEKNPQIIPMMAIFEDGVGPDTISDMTTTLIMPALAEITEAFCAANNIPVQKFGSAYGSRSLPPHPFVSGEPVLLVPRDILRDLPLAADWSDVSRVMFEVQAIRDTVNQMFGDISKKTLTEKKAAVRSVALSSLARFRAIFNAIFDESESYDEAADLDGQYTFRQVIGENPALFAGRLTRPIEKNAASLRGVVERIIAEFKTMVESNDLWQLLWHGDTPKKERASQLLFFAIANVICAANNVDISPETNSGGGPVDFKFSTGYIGRQLVEIKLSKGQVVSGYQLQLERYRQAVAGSEGIFLVVDVGGMKTKLAAIRRLQKEARERGEIACEIFYVDARQKKSASKIR